MPNQSWYDEQENPRLVIAKVGVYSTGIDEPAGEVFKFLTNKGYNTVDGNTLFIPLISGSLRISETLGEENGLTMSYGDLELTNQGGDLDSWLDSSKYVWVNRPITIFYGDPRTVVNSAVDISANFDTIFDGVIADIDSRNINTINVRFRDKLERLNTPVSEEVLGPYGTWGSGSGQTNQNTVIPIAFGEPHNIPAMLIDPSQLEFYAAAGPLEQVIQVRDNGVPIYTNGSLLGQVVIDSSTGKFKLTKPLVGECTLSLQGLKKSYNFATGTLTNNYRNTIANAIAILVTLYGNANTRLSISELDLANFADFDFLNDQPIGLYINSRENLLSVCQSLASSVGAQVYFNRIGKLQLIRFGQYTSDPIVQITKSDMLLNSFNTSGRTGVVAARKIGYAKNWYVQSNLVTAIPSEHKYMYSTEYWDKTSNDSTGIKSLYKLNGEPPEKQTLLIRGVDAMEEAERLNNYFGVPHSKYRFTGRSRLMTLKLGQEVQIVYDRFNLNNGKSGQVISLSTDWLLGRVEVEVII